jgi:hypothetical protein
MAACINNYDAPVLWNKHLQSFCADASNRVPVECNRSSERTRRIRCRFFFNKKTDVRNSYTSGCTVHLEGTETPSYKIATTLYI